MSRHWPKVRLGDVLRRAERFELRDELTEYPFAGTYSYARGVFAGERKLGASFALPKIQRIREGDFVYCKIMAWEGAFGLVPKDADGCVMSGAFVVYELNRDKIDPRFLDFFFKVPSHWQSIGGQSTGTNVRRQSLHPAQFEKSEIPLPPLAEQRRIVARIEELAVQIHEARALREQAGSEAEALRAAQANSIFSKAMFEKWPHRRLEEVAEIRSGVTLGRQLAGRTVKLPYLRVANVQDGHLNLREIKEVEVLETEVAKWQLLDGDLLLTEGGDWDKLGRGTVWRNEIPNCIHQNHIFRVRTRGDEFVPEFLAALIGSPVGKTYFQEASKQTTNLASINQRQLKAFLVVQPPISEQRRIVAELDALQAEVDTLKRHQADTAAELDALLPAILDRAFRGEL